MLFLSTFLLITFIVDHSFARVSPPMSSIDGTDSNILIQLDDIFEKGCGCRRVNSTTPTLIPAYPWEIVDGKVKKFKFIIINYRPDLFDSDKVEAIAKTLEKYVSKYVFPSWRMAVEISFYTPPSLASLTSGIPAYANPNEDAGTYIPIYLTDEFSSNVPKNFSIAVHGCASTSVMNGLNPFSYLSDALTNSFTVNPLPLGTPFIVIPAGSADTGNGINSAVAANTANPSLGPIDYYQCFSLALSHEVIEVLINPTGVHYTGSGIPIGEGSTQYFYLREAVDPFSQGKDNIFKFRGWSMTNFAFPAYFFPFNDSGIYDFLGNGSAPFTPYKGNQFFLFQRALGSPTNTTDLECGFYVSSPKKPKKIKTISNGSIYTYSGWGLKSSLLVGKHEFSTVGIHPKCQQSWNQMEASMISCELVSTKGSKRTHRSSKYQPGTKPQLLPFQYLDKSGFVATRFRVINYIPDILPPESVDNSIVAMNLEFKNRFLPHWNVKPIIVANDTVYTDADLPIFDGTFIPIFFLKTEQFNPDGAGQPSLSQRGGAANLNNNPNPLAGPLISDYLVNPPNLPLGNPYVLSGQVNFPSSNTLEKNMQFFTLICTHECEELIVDPTYADYIATSNPPVDGAILFTHREVCDPVENLVTNFPYKGNNYNMSAFVLPSFFSASLRANNYDNTSVVVRPLVPSYTRNEIVFQEQNNPLQVANIFINSQSYVDSFFAYYAGLTPPEQALYTSVLPYVTVNNLFIENTGNIFDRQTFFPNNIPKYPTRNFLPIIPYNISPIGAPTQLSPLDSIYTDLLDNHFIVQNGTP